VARRGCEALVADPAGLLVGAMGSFRRGKPSSGDADVLISHRDGRSHAGLV
jgi:hypothetical protein